MKDGWDGVMDGRLCILLYCGSWNRYTVIPAVPSYSSISISSISIRYDVAIGRIQ